MKCLELWCYIVDGKEAVMKKRIIPKHCMFLHEWLLVYKLRLEYGENKLIVCHISKDANMLFKRAYKEVIDLSELERYGFSKDLYGHNLAEHKCVARDKYVRQQCFEPSLREIVFELKDGRVIPFESANFLPTQLHDLMIYIEKNTGIRPSGSLGISLLTAEFSKEEINFIYDSVFFSKEKLQDIELKIANICFTKEAVVVCNPARIVYIPYDKLLAVSFFQQLPLRYNMITKPCFSCCFWLKNGQRYGCRVDEREDFKRISLYMKQKHQEIEADAELIWAGTFW